MHHKKEIFNYEVYKNKYKDISLVLKNEFEYKKHWELVGHKTRNLEQEDWKLFILQNPYLLYNCIDSKDRLDKYNYDYKNINISFDVIKYVNKYDDLKSAFGTNYNDAYKHFLENGCWEGRTSF